VKAAGADPDETAAALLHWIEQDPYGFCAHVKRQAVAFCYARRAGSLLPTPCVRDKQQRTLSLPAHNPSMTTSISSTRRTAILKALDTVQRKIDAYPSLCPADALTPADCEVVADLYQQHHDPQAALHWIERGLQLETQGRRGASYRLTELQRSVLHQLHRPEEALALAMARLSGGSFNLYL